MHRFSVAVETVRPCCSPTAAAASRILAVPLPVKAETGSIGAQDTGRSCARTPSLYILSSRSSPSFERRSHLLTRIRQPLPSSATSSARRKSWVSTPSWASSTRTATSARFMARSACCTDAPSKPSLFDRAPTLARLRIPAVSTRRNLSPVSSQNTVVSTASRVVPAVELTTARSSPTSALSSEDLPTLGRPRMARASPPSASASCSDLSSSRLLGSGRSSNKASSISAVPDPCLAEIANGSSPSSQ
mmetsp:Transcript_8624/g.16698  ORF Transcript_8624/g.16698 Transcript_8624/m.16698 type:complete len:247 (-) Transcript_8624:937-1677(-)